MCPRNPSTSGPTFRGSSEPLEQLAHEGQLAAYRHTDFWYCMDTMRDVNLLDKFWQDGNQPKQIITKEFFWEKLDYIHNNPVDEMIVEKPEDYLYSSARNYADMKGLLDVVLETRKVKSY